MTELQPLIIINAGGWFWFCQWKKIWVVLVKPIWGKAWRKTSVVMIYYLLSIWILDLKSLLRINLHCVIPCPNWLSIPYILDLKQEFVACLIILFFDENQSVILLLLYLVNKCNTILGQCDCSSWILIWWKAWRWHKTWVSFNCEVQISFFFWNIYWEIFSFVIGGTNSIIYGVLVTLIISLMSNHYLI
jgi:hypothetical protein